MPKISNVCVGQLIGHVGQNSGNLLDTLDKCRISSKVTQKMAASS